MTFPKLNILISYAYGKKREILDTLAAYKDHLCVMIDSGAFTVKHAGGIVTMDEYCAWLDGLPFEPWQYIMLDVIGDPAATKVNYIDMLRRGYKPAPVMTRGQPLTDMEWYYDSADLVCFGGIGLLASKKVMAGRIAKIMAQANGRRVHLLGYTNLPAIKHFRPTSCDSSTWLAGQKYGTLCLYYGNGHIAKRTNVQMRKRPSDRDFEVAAALGYDLHEMQRLSNRTGGPTRSKMSALSIASWVACSVDLERMLGVKLFLAIGGDVSTFEVIINEYIKQKERHELRQNDPLRSLRVEPAA